MNVVVGDATGQIKVVSLKVDGPIRKLGTQEASRGGITCMAWAGAQNRESEVAIGLSKGAIEIWDLLNNDKVAQMQGFSFGKKEDKYSGLHVLRHGSGVEHRDDITRKLITATSYGFVSIASWLPLLPDIDDEEEELLAETMSATQIELFKQKRNTERTAVLKAREAEYATGVAHFRAGKHIERTRVAPTQDILATGGKDNKVRLWDLETQQPIYSTKNMPNNYLNLAVPNWDMDFAFFGHHHTTNPRPNSNGYMFATVTGHNEVRIYDPRDGTKRPAQYKNLGEHVARSVAISNDEHYVLCGDAAGKIHRFDLRKSLTPLGTMKGSCGSIRQIETHPSLPMIASVSLDRHLRVHDVESRKVLKEVYLTQKLTDCLFSAVVPGEQAKSFLGKKFTVADDAETEKKSRPKPMGDDEEDEIWDRLGAATKLSEDQTKAKKTNNNSNTKIEIKSEKKGTKAIKGETIDLASDNDGDDGDEYDFDDFDYGEGEDGFEDFSFTQEGEDILFDDGEGEDGEGEDGDLFFAEGEGEDGEGDDWDEDCEDEDDADDFTCSFVILGADGKPMGKSTSTSVAPPTELKSATNQPQPTRKNQPIKNPISIKMNPQQQSKQQQQQQPPQLPPPPPPQEPTKRKGFTTQVEPVKRQRK